MILNKIKLLNMYETPFFRKKMHSKDQLNMLDSLSLFAKKKGL